MKKQKHIAKRVVAFGAMILAFGLSAMTSQADELHPYIDICGTVTVDGVPASGVTVTALSCDDTNVVIWTVSDEAEINNYHLLYDPFNGGPYIPLEIILTFSYGDCPAVVMTCEQIADAYVNSVDGKPIINVNIPCGVEGGGGHTPGFWQNKNGQALISTND